MPSVVEESSGAVVLSSTFDSDMQSNGVIHENGTSDSDFAVNGLGVIKSNGVTEEGLCEGEALRTVGRSGHTDTVLSRKKKRQLSDKDADIIRLIGQHLREMGFR